MTDSGVLVVSVADLTVKVTFDSLLMSEPATQLFHNHYQQVGPLSVFAHLLLSLLGGQQLNYSIND